MLFTGLQVSPAIQLAQLVCGSQLQRTHSRTLSGFSQTSLTKDLLAGSCTSCQVSQDKSAYWHPALYFEDASTGQYELVNQVGGLSV